MKSFDITVTDDDAKIDYDLSIDIDGNVDSFSVGEVRCIGGRIWVAKRAAEFNLGDWSLHDRWAAGNELRAKYYQEIVDEARDWLQAEIELQRYDDAERLNDLKERR